MITKRMLGFNSFVHEVEVIDMEAAAEMDSAYRILKFMKSGANFGVLSASKGSSSEAENKKRYKELALELQALHYEFIEFTSSYKVINKKEQFKIEERLFFVKEVSRAVITFLGRKYDQENVVFGNSESASSINLRDEGNNIELDRSGMLLAWATVFLNPGTYPS